MDRKSEVIAAVQQSQFLHGLSLANALFAELSQAETSSRLPEAVVRSQVSELMSKAYLAAWQAGDR